MKKSRLVILMFVMLLLIAALVSCNGADIPDDAPNDAEPTEAPVHTHQYEPTYTWDGQTMNITLICKDDPTHIQSLTATATKEVTAEATCKDNGEITYTASAELLGQIYTQTHTETIPATGKHEYDTNNVCKNCKEEVVPSKGLAYKLVTRDYMGGGSEEVYLMHRGACEDTNIIIAPYHNGKRVEIDEMAFDEVYYCADFPPIESVIISEGIREIGRYAFAGCESLKSVTLPTTVKSINASFWGCSGLEELKVREGNEKYFSINNCIVEKESKTIVVGCSTSVIPNDKNITVIGERAFNGVSNVKEIVIPDNITVIGSYAFQNCTALEKIIIPDSVFEICDYAFQKCTSLKELHIPASTSLIGLGIASGCSALEAITVDENNRHYVSADSNCIINEFGVAIQCCKASNMEDVTLGERSFFDFGIESLTINAEVIESWAIIDDKLTEVTITTDCIYIMRGAFTGCTNLVRVNYEGTMEEWDSICSGDFDGYDQADYAVYCSDGIFGH